MGKRRKKIGVVGKEKLGSEASGEVFWGGERCFPLPRSPLGSLLSPIFFLFDPIFLPFPPTEEPGPRLMLLSQDRVLS